MSMEINDRYNNYNNYQTNDLEARRAEREKAREDEPENAPALQDEYVHGEEDKPSGLYRLGKDEDGNPKVLYDDPKKAKKPQSDRPEHDEEECTMSTDAVDREIEKLKTQKQQLEQQLQSEDDEKKVQELKQKLAQVEGELSQKDNDTYRRQHSTKSDNV